MLRTQALSIVTEVAAYLIAGTTLVLPLFFLPITTEPFEIPKQLLLVVVTLVLLVLFGIRGILERRLSIRRTPFDVGLIILFATAVASIFLSQNRAVSLMSGVPVLAAILFVFLAINMITTKSQERIVLVALLTGAIVLSILSILQFLKIYVLPYPAAKAVGFSLAGSLLAATIFLALSLPIGIGLVRSHLRAMRDEVWTATFVASVVLIGIGLIISIYQLATIAKPILLSQEAGLKTALQPLGINFQTALFGTGPGSYLFDFTRFRDASLNGTSLWNLRFTNSSSLFLELLATLGLVGALSFLYLAFGTVTTFVRSQAHQAETVGLFVSLVFACVLSVLLPFSFTTFFLLFVLFALYAIRLGNEGNAHVLDVTISVVALRKGLIAVERDEEFPHGSAIGATDILPYSILLLFLLTAALVVFGIPGQRLSLTRFLISDITFQKALVAASQNNAKETYDLQNAAINTFPHRDLYHRIFSQTNLAIANSIAQQARTATPSAQGATLTEQDKQTIITLVRQSIDFGRNASLLSPLNVINWENLSTIYRNLIGFAQNADQFAIASALQAVSLDPTNPLLRLQVGGIYYQLGQYDNAVREFQLAVRLKQDFANAHYNLGHAYEAKGNTESLRTTLSIYQTVRNLVQPDSEDFKKIDGEIAVLEKKIPQPGSPPAAAAPAPPTQEPLQISTPSATLPTQRPPVPVEGPPATESATNR